MRTPRAAALVGILSVSLLSGCAGPGRGAPPAPAAPTPACADSAAAVDESAVDARPTLRHQPLPALPSPAGRTLVEARDFVFLAVISPDGSTCVERLVEGPRFQPEWPELAASYRAALEARTWTPGTKGGAAIATRMRVTMKFYPYTAEAAGTTAPSR